MEHFYKIIVDWNLQRLGPYEACFTPEMLSRAAVEEFDELLSAYGDDPDALPDFFPVGKGQVRLAFFASHYDEAVTMKNLLDRVLPQGVSAFLEEGEITLYPRRISLTGDVHILLGEEVPSLPGEKALRLSGSQIFGTGEHATTRLMAEMMGSCDFSGKRVIDAGAGSGILTLYALLKGAKELYAFDVADNFSEVAARVMALNGVSFHAFQEDHNAFASHYRLWDKTDFLLANMLPRYLFPVLALFAEKLSPETCVLLSGIPDRRRKEAEEFFEQVHFSFESSFQREEWAGYTGRFTPQ